MSKKSNADFVAEKAKEVIEKLELDPGFVRTAREINTALSLIVTTERNEIMRRALDRRNQTNLLPE